MPLVDTHAHLTSRELQPQLGQVLANCAAHGVDQVITVSSNRPDAAACAELASRCPGVFATVGIHPHEAGKCQPGDIEAITALAANEHVVAVGEIGLDYYYDFADRSVQRDVFAAQLEAVRARDMPTVIHCRDAFDDCVAILRDSGYNDRAVVFHCFTGTDAEAQVLADQGWRISFTGIVTFKKSTQLQAIARQYPADKLMIETDSPYLSPDPVRHIRPNEPAHVAHIVRFLARIRDVPEQELAAQTTANARAFFQLSNAVLSVSGEGTA